MEMDAEQERQAYENIGNKNKDATTYGSEEGPSYEKVVEELKKFK